MNKDITIVVYGQTGSGKSMIIRLIRDALAAADLGMICFDDTAPAETDRNEDEEAVWQDLKLQNCQRQMRFKLIGRQTNRFGYHQPVSAGDGGTTRLVEPFNPLANCSNCGDWHFERMCPQGERRKSTQIEVW